MKEQKIQTDNEDLYLKVLSLNEDLFAVAQIARIARDRIKYPIKSYDGFHALADPNTDYLKLDDNFTVTMEHAVKYFPEVFFPIEDENQLIRKLLIAFNYGRSVHETEIKVRGYPSNVNQDHMYKKED